MLFAAARFTLCLFTLAVLAACTPEVNLPERYAIVYGISDYAGSGNDLTWPEYDAADMENLLGRNGYEVIKRIDSGATQAQLADDINDIIYTRAAARDSFFLFYFSGHGAQMQTRGPEPGAQDGWDEYIFLYDSSDIYDGGVSDDELMGLISRVPSRQKVVIIDACNSGGFIGDFPGVDLGTSSPLFNAGAAFSAYFANTESGDIPYTGAIVLAAAGERELSYDSPTYSNGVFTHFLLETARRADWNGDGYVTVSEAYYYIKNGINSTWNSRLPPGGSPFSPRLSGSALDFVLFEAE
jgi:uncharacterized caspase-like protein